VIATEVLSSGIIFGEVLLLSGWESALLTVGLFESMKLLNWLIAPKQFAGPEFFSAVATNRQLALKIVQLRLEMIKRDEVLAERQAALAREVEELRGAIVGEKGPSSPPAAWWEIWKR